MSVFLEVPKEAWIFASALAIAFRDRFPVAPGHTLVVSIEEIETALAPPKQQPPRGRSDEPPWMRRAGRKRSMVHDPNIDWDID